MVLIFPNLWLWRRSLRSNLGGIDPDKLYRATLMCLPVEQVQVYWNFYTDEYRAESKFGTRKELFVLN